MYEVWEKPVGAGWLVLWQGQWGIGYTFKSEESAQEAAAALNAIVAREMGLAA